MAGYQSLFCENYMAIASSQFKICWLVAISVKTNAAVHK